MKKLVLLFVAIAAISFASCGGNKTAAPAANADSDTVQVADTTVDTTTVADTTNAQ